SHGGAILIPATSLVPGLGQATSAAVRPQGFLKRSTAIVVLIGVTWTRSVSGRLGSSDARFAMYGCANCCRFHPILLIPSSLATYAKPRLWAALPFARRAANKMISEETTSLVYGSVPWNSVAESIWICNGFQ